MAKLQTVQEFVTAYLKHVKAGMSPSTLKTYTKNLKPFLERFHNRCFSDLEPFEIEEYFDQVKLKQDGSEKAPDTIRLLMTAFENLQKWGIENKQLQERVAPRMKKPKGRRRERLPNERERELLLRAASPAFRLVYKALRQSGCRPNEMARAMIADLVTFDDSRMVVLSDHKTAKKTGEARRIPVGEKLGALIDASIGDRTEGPLFLSPRGSPWTAATLSKTFYRLRKRLNLADDLVLYLTRHEHATQVYSKTKDIHATARALGHSSIQTTQRYVKDNVEELTTNQDCVE
ncbi:tyrosine-type recombinase/integrase [Gimesia fumaroli]|uniref:Tyrosine recombinase XerC n=1 Tax=Gimesia fumaroli TaxID=2527976 RepID=A0A518ICP3_9PLAN|nr:tyrosine-type recombinase/integrase [Gimesia fumaroli]QDV50867.1 Tyrosine recombinase XerC [Gimesia fumaroli]